MTDRSILIDEYVRWLRESGFRMDKATMFTGTYDLRDDEERTVYKDWAGIPIEAVFGHIKYFVQELNTAVLGKYYRNKVKHSYFGYVGSVERHRSGSWHVHVVIDDIYSFYTAHNIWREKFGQVTWINKKSGEAAIRYAIKYVLKCGADPLVWVPRKRLDLVLTESTPKFKPLCLLRSHKDDSVKGVGDLPTSEGSRPLTQRPLRYDTA